MKHPPFCPNQECSHYLDPKGRWYVKDGTFQNNRNGKVQRFKCLSCGKKFSVETFSLDYCANIKVSYKSIFEHISTSSGIRDLSRILKVSCNVIQNRVARLARQAMATSEVLSKHIILNEDLVADGFESFVKSQYMPNNINILAGKDSQFWFMSDYAQLTRKGRMTESQKKKNEALKPRLNVGRRTIYESFYNVALEALHLAPRTGIILYTDEHLQYVKVMSERNEQERRILRHIRINSKVARTLRNPLFSVNYLDREIRKDNSDHTRETVQFSRNVCNMMDRLSIYRFYHNFIKPFRINGKSDSAVTHAQRAGIPRDIIRNELKTFFTQRRFLGRIGIPNISDWLLWHRGLFTPLKGKADYIPAYALD